MALDSKHPQYAIYLPDWQLMRHSYEGSRCVKAQGTAYLPATSGMEADGMMAGQAGYKAYQADITRTVYRAFVTEAVKGLIGVMHHKPAEIKLPKAMEPMVERATLEGESLQTLLRRINEAQLTTGRLGLLLDIPAKPPADAKPQPYIATYHAESIINWDTGRRDDENLPTLNFVVLDESEDERQADFEWERVTKYRVLLLSEEAAQDASVAVGDYLVGVFRKDAQNTASFDVTKMKPPSIMGKTLDFIPFTIVNALDVLASPSQPPLLDLANLAMAIYRGEADLRQALFMQAQDTLVISGGESESTDDQGNTTKQRVGAGACIYLPEGGDAKYIGVESNGLPQMIEVLEADKKDAAAKGGQLLDTTGRQKESGDALQTRVSAQTATLNLVALAGAFGLQTVLRQAAKWLGLDPEEVTVTPNLDFEDIPLTGKELLDMVSAKNAGAPISRQTIHDTMRARRMTNLDLEEEMALIEGEAPMEPTIKLPIDPNAPDPALEDDPAA